MGCPIAVASTTSNIFPKSSVLIILKLWGFIANGVGNRKEANLLENSMPVSQSSYDSLCSYIADTGSSSLSSQKANDVFKVYIC